MEHVMREMLEAAARRTGCHMPGHGGRQPFMLPDLYRLDTTELSVTDDLYDAQGAIRHAETLYASAAGAGDSLFLHNGSTQGVHVLLEMYTCHGDTVILPRNCHLSAVQGCVLGGLKPVWVQTREVGGYVYAAPEDVVTAMRAHPEAKCVLLTRPDYFGGCMEIGEIAKTAKEMGMRLVVDEAHGAHLPWHEHLLSAGQLGADAWVQSAHKTLPALTGSAVLHLRNGNERWRALRILRREQTSSPSFLLMLSLDEARIYMKENGVQALRRQREMTERIRQAALQRGYTDPRSTWRTCGYAFDENRLVLRAPEGGNRLLKKLADLGIDIEMAMGNFAVLLTPLLQTEAENKRICKAFSSLSPDGEIQYDPYPGQLPEQVILPREAACGPVEAVPLERTAGRIAAESAGCYPPGIPLVVPGERISGTVSERLVQAGESGRFGVYEGMMLCVAV